MRLTIEHAGHGPLAHQPTLLALERAVASTSTLDEVDLAISAIPSLATYRGGRHVAVHPVWAGRFSNGSQRVAIVTEEKR